tara:strand:+ start:1557 stop:2069 length:513 start_codon:yes stop_codon:yes gene_type:complete
MTLKPNINLKYLSKNWERLTRFDEIRIYKLIEIIYYCIIALILAVTIGPIANYFTPEYGVSNKDDDKYNNEAKIKNETATNQPKSENTLLLALKTGLNFGLILIIAYYIYKIIRVVPFLLNFSNKYISSLKNENEAGLGFIIGIILYGSQNKMKKNISELEQRTMKYFKL